ncbi:MAG: response regulator [Candidatus Omnitrophica bacterium]|nr:response regulator [Candidatus Omnitrophota bacterium]MDE2009173.1 response regulator [Candidatus Omnitrophota bacterium]MDE2213694.1 response regulator [Candidatus Omnitrophota bacterium]MDE2230731.1 response regulator [Candidatus Omnitrophota bacterium]
MNPAVIKILIADDEEAAVEIMARKIASQGYEVIAARDGEDAWNKINSGLPDVIILDLNMPKMDGWAVLSRLRQNPPVKRWQPVIIVSAQGDLESFRKGVDLQADHYLAKPCQIEDILKAIRLMLSLVPQRGN